MPTISAICKEFGYTKDQVLALLHDATGKEYSANASRIGDSTYTVLVDHINSTASTPSTPSKKQQPAQTTPSPEASPAPSLSEAASPFGGSPFGDDAGFLSSIGVSEDEKASSETDASGGSETFGDMFGGATPSRTAETPQAPAHADDDDRATARDDEDDASASSDADEPRISVQERLSGGATNARVIRSEPVGPDRSRKSERPRRSSERSRRPRVSGSLSISNETYRDSSKDKPQKRVSSTDRPKPVVVKPTIKKGSRTAGRRASVVRPSTANLPGRVSRATPQRTHKKLAVSPQSSSTLVKKEEITISDAGLTVKEFSEKIGLPLGEVMKTLLRNKIILAAHANMDVDTAMLLGEELGVKVNKEAARASQADVLAGDLSAILAPDKESDSKELRPPIVTVMGHVDHGKTKLLDYMRHTNIVDAEAGGITQKIGSSQVTHDGKKITFVDTPGHELFTSMRARGARVTDIVIIVVAGDEGCKEQTIEAISHAKAAEVPIIVAITKVDKPNLIVDKITGQVAEQGLTPEEWGGDVPVVQVSAMTGQGIDDLLETILLIAEMNEYVSDPQRNGVGVVVESHRDPKQGVVTAMIVMSGMINQGHILAVHDTYGKVRRMTDATGAIIKTAQGGDPITMLGLQDVAEPGSIVEVVNNEKEARNKAGIVAQATANTNKQGALSSLMAKISEGQETNLNLIVKADSVGTLEAVKYALEKVELPETVEIKFVHTGVGAPSLSDVILAQASEAVIVCFNIPLAGSIKKDADRKGVAIKSYNIIYELTEYIEQLATGMVDLEEQEVHIGKLNVLAVFFKRGKEMIIGGRVIEGKVTNGAKFLIMRGDEEVGKGTVTSLQKAQENVSEIGQGFECGMKVKIDKKVMEEDILDFFVIEHVAPGS